MSAGEVAVAEGIAGHQVLVAGMVGTVVPTEVVAVASSWCEAVLGSPVVHVAWVAAGSGLVLGVDLGDGRALALKVRPADQATRIEEARTLQAALAGAGLPVPVPVGPLAPLGPGGLAGAEVRLDGVGPLDARAAGGAEVMASLLHRIVVVATARAPAHLGLHEPWGIALPADRLWPDPPHDPGFDLSLPGGEAIDVAARGFRSRVVAGAEGVDRAVGHVDWRAEHVLVDPAGEVRGILDWDSLVRAPEAVLVGQAAAGWTIAWGRPDPHPTVAEGATFVAAYEAARGTPFTGAERDLLDAAHGYVAAYGARCEHSDEVTGRNRSDGWRRLLAERGARALV